MTRPRGRLPKRDDLPLHQADYYLVRDKRNEFDAHTWQQRQMPSFPIDVSEGITDWGMCGNDQWGDCGPAAEWHLEMTTARASGAPEPSPTSTAAVERYKTYTGCTQPPGPGVVLADYLTWLVQRKVILAFAPVDHTTRTACEWWMSEGYGLYVGINLNSKAEEQFDAGEPWDVGPTDEPDPTDGHAILWVRSETTAGPHGFVTWGKVQTATEAWVRACLSANPNAEAFVVVTTEEQMAPFEPGLLDDVKALAQSS